MIRALSVALLLSSALAWGEDKCYKYKLTGLISEKDSAMVMTVAKGTSSERIFPIPQKDQLKVLAFLDMSAQLNVVMKSKALSLGSKILAVEKADLSIEDILNQNASTVATKISETKCP